MIGEPKQRPSAMLENRIGKYLGIFFECPYSIMFQEFNKAKLTDKSHGYIVESPASRQ